MNYRLGIFLSIYTFCAGTTFDQLEKRVNMAHALLKNTVNPNTAEQAYILLEHDINTFHSVISSRTPTHQEEALIEKAEYIAGELSKKYSLTSPLQVNKALSAIKEIADDSKSFSYLSYFSPETLLNAIRYILQLSKKDFDNFLKTIFKKLYTLQEPSPEIEKKFKSLLEECNPSATNAIILIDPQATQHYTPLFKLIAPHSFVISKNIDVTRIDKKKLCKQYNTIINDQNWRRITWPSFTASAIVGGLHYAAAATFQTIVYVYQNSTIAKPTHKYYRPGVFLTSMTVAFFVLSIILHDYAREEIPEYS